MKISTEFSQKNVYRKSLRFFRILTFFKIFWQFKESFKFYSPSSCNLHQNDWHQKPTSEISRGEAHSARCSGFLILRTPLIRLENEPNETIAIICRLRSLGFKVFSKCNSSSIDFPFIYNNRTLSWRIAWNEWLTVSLSEESRVNRWKKGRCPVDKTRSKGFHSRILRAESARSHPARRKKGATHVRTSWRKFEFSPDGCHSTTPGRVSMGTDPPI